MLKFKALIAASFVFSCLIAAQASASLTFTNLNVTANSFTVDVSGTLPALVGGNNSTILYFENDPLGTFGVVGWVIPTSVTSATSLSFSGSQTVTQFSTGSSSFGDYIFLRFSNTLSEGEALVGTITGTWGSDVFDPSAIDSMDVYWAGLSFNSSGGATLVSSGINAPPPSAYTVGGTVSGKGNDFTLLNNGGDALSITSDGSFTFDTALPEGDLYAVSVDASSLDPSDSCSVTNGNGTIGTADVTNVAVTCERVFQLGGIISGVTFGGSITLQNNGGDDLTWNDDPITSYRFPTRLAQGATYNVTVLTPPTSQTCTVANATGTMSNSNFVDVNVTCVDNVIPTYSVGGNVSGLTGTGLALQNNGADTLPVAANGPFTFLTELGDTTAYAVTVSTQPTGQTCIVTDGSGAIAAADVTNVAVACVDDEVPPVVPPTPATPIPTLSQWALIMLSMFLGLMVFANRRRLF